MIVIGVDAHMRSHTVVAVDAGTGRQLEELTVRADEAGYRRLLEFAKDSTRSVTGRSRTAAICPGI